MQASSRWFPFLLLAGVCVPPVALFAQGSPWAGDPILQRAFVAGYGVNTAIEPDISEADRKVLEAIQPVIEKSRGDAILSLEKYVDDTTNARFDLILANLQLEQQKFEPAILLFQQAIKKFPNFRAAHKNLAMAYLQTRRHREALEHLSKAVQLGEADGAVMGLIGQCHLALDNSTEAETAFRYAAFLQPTALDWKRGAIAALIKQRRFPEAIGYLDAMIARDPDNREFLVQQAQVYSANGEHLKAAELIELLALDGRANGDDLLQLGDLYVHSGLARLAVRAYQQAALKTDKLDRLVKAAEVMAGSGALKEAADLIAALHNRFKEATAPVELKKRVLKVDAKLAAARKADDDSIKILRELTETDPLDGDAWLLLGKAYQDKKDAERAIFAYERAAAIEVFKPDANLRLAQIYVAKQEFTKAIPLVEEAQRLKPRDSVGRYLDQLRLIARSKG
jgi:tetratricopeptide (TPR) repeat protein